MNFDSAVDQTIIFQSYCDHVCIAQQKITFPNLGLGQIKVVTIMEICCMEVYLSQAMFGQAQRERRTILVCASDFHFHCQTSYSGKSRDLRSSAKPRSLIYLQNKNITISFFTNYLINRRPGADCHNPGFVIL